MYNTAKQNYPGFVAFYDTQPETRWAYSTMLPNPLSTSLLITWKTVERFNIGL